MPGLNNFQRPSANYVRKTGSVAHLSLRELVTNPAGSGSAYLYSREKIKREMNSEFIYTLQRYRRQFSARPYIFPDGRVMFVCKVPSSNYAKNKLVYDVVVEIHAEKGRRLAVCDAKFFSNCMSFVFTYAYAFYHSSLMIDRFTDLLPRRCLTDFPKVRNPVLSLGYEKSLFFAARYLIDGLCLTSHYINKYGLKARTGFETQIKSTITSVDKLIAIYQHAKELEVKNPRKPVDQSRRAEREKLKRDYIEKRKEDARAKYTKPARSRLTARKARRIIERGRR